MTTKETHTTLIIKSLEGGLTSGEKIYLETWLKEKPENKQEFENYALIWKASSDAKIFESIDTSADWQKVAKKLNISNKKTISLKPIISIAASIIILVGTFIYLKTLNTVKYVAKENIEKVQLADGSVVWLNAESNIKLNKSFNTKNRDISLQGEAYFEIASNKNLPLIVDNGNTKVTVVGTKFNVFQDKNNLKTEVTVLEGKVKFTSKNKKQVMLTKDQVGIYNGKSNILTSKTVDNPNVLSWYSGKLVFNNTPITKVVQCLSKHYNTNVTLKDSTLFTNLKITAHFENQELNDVMTEICTIFDIEYIKEENSIILEPGK